MENNDAITQIQGARDEFIEVISHAENLLDSFDSTQFRHVVMLSSGDAADEYQKSLSEEIQLITDKLTFDISDVQWRGIDIAATFPSYTLYPWRMYHFPAFNPVTIQLTVFNGKTKLYITGSALHLESSVQYTRLRIFDLKGRLLISLEPRKYLNGKGHYLFPLRNILSRLRCGVFIVKLTSSSGNKVFHFANGRIQ